MTKTSFDKQRKQFLEALLETVPFEGWSELSMQQAAKQCKFEPHYEKVLFQAGIEEAIDAFIEMLVAQTTKAVNKEALDSMRIRERIHRLIMIRLEAMEPYKLVVSKLLSYFACHPCCGASKTWDSASQMWYEAGDTSTHFDYYTKRLILMGVYSGAILYWLQDESKDHEATAEFVSRRIDNVMQIMKVRRKLEAVVSS